MGCFGRVGLKMFELIILKVLMQNLISCSIQCQNHNLENLKRSRILRFWVLMPFIPENQNFLYGQTLGSANSAKDSWMKIYWHYSVKQWLTLILPETFFKEERTKNVFCQICIFVLSWFTTVLSIKACFCFS